MTANRMTIGNGWAMSDSPRRACATNSHSTPKIMKTFHSSGTPMGKASRMLRWNTIITNAAMAVGQLPCENSRTSGTSPSTAVEKWAMKPAKALGRRSSGWCLNIDRLSGPGRDEWIVRQHGGDDEGKVLVEFGRRRAEPDHHE